MNFKDKVIVVTGSYSGIGQSLVKTFLKHKSKIVSSDKLLLNRKVKENYYERKCDVRVENDIRSLIKFTIKTFNKIDIFFSNAGILTIGDENTSNKEWIKNWQVHLMSHVYVCRYILPEFRSQKSGYILITSSAAGLLTHIDSLTYSVTKHAAISLAEWIAINNNEFGVNVSVLCPQAVKTNMILGRENDIASVDGILTPEMVVKEVIVGIKKKQFLILPHKKVKEYFKFKSIDYDKWLNGIINLKKKF